MSLESFEDGWDSHISNICNMATNGSCVFTFLDRARELNPDFAFLEDIGRQYRRTAEIWNNDNGKMCIRDRPVPPYRKTNCQGRKLH